MRERDLRALEFDKLLTLVAAGAASEPGRVAVLGLQPSIKSDEVRESLRATAELVELRGHAGELPIGEFADIRSFLMAAAPDRAVLEGAALVGVRNFVLTVRHLAAFMRSRLEAYPRVAALAHNLIAPRELADSLLGALADDGGVLDDASPQLHRLRNRLRDGRLDLEARLARQLNTGGMEQFVSDYVVTVRNRRFVLPLKLNYSEKLEGIVQDRSVSGETLFVEPIWAIDLNNRLMMLEREAETEERRILSTLTAMVRGYARELRLTFDAMVALDALNARAIFAQRAVGVEPEIVEGELDLEGARHPLLSTAAPVVPIDVRVRPDRHGIVISGPNTGGKTVALKTIGLLAMMAQSGILVPAVKARMPVFAGVFVDIGDEQSIENSLSTFAAHIANLRDIAGRIASPALVILDEPGGGTDPAEGAALAIGLMSYFRARDCILAIATHSMAVKLHAYTSGDFEASAVDFDAARLTPLYRLKAGTIGESYGLAVAQRLGLPEEILDAAEAARPAGTLELERSLRQLEEERRALEAERARVAQHEREFAAAADRANHELARARDRYDAERERISAETGVLIAEMRRESAEIAREIRAQNRPRSALRALADNAAARASAIVPPAAEARAEPAVLRVGDQVEFGDLRGELLQLEAGRAVVGRGGLRIEVAPERLRPAQSPQAAAARPRVTVHVGAGDQPGDLNLIGMRTAEALRRLEEFLDQAVLTNRAEVRIVHGIGSGALRRAITAYLRDSPYCESYREAEIHHGGAGATIVVLRS
jgi:DNA mismatch repair protein MutS2